MKNTVGSLAILFAVIMSGTVFATTLNVPASYPTIQSAIDASAWGDVVLVDPGEYVGTIYLKSGVTVKSLSGPEVTTIRGTDTHVVVYGADSSTINGFTITGSWAGISSANLSPVTLISNNIISDYVGIENGYSSPTIANNLFVNCSYGVENNSSSPLIISNEFYCETMGVGNGHSSQAIISNNVVSGSQYGIYSSSNSTPTVTNNIIVSNSRGIQNDDASITLTNNTIYGNTFGILNQYNSSPTVTNNIITNNSYGIYNHTYVSAVPVITYNGSSRNRVGQIISP